jgi:hypothetical protein
MVIGLPEVLDAQTPQALTTFEEVSIRELAGPAEIFGERVCNFDTIFVERPSAN